ncbi:hypothetical protein GCM10010302_04710 [Streptomyces polychromogenes]|uniref:Uncharacterized protein n=1 Tax=Streptomyces polychromogenes TaxID=67342 RepID=A0ABN0V171_9ACTN
MFEGYADRRPPTPLKSQPARPLPVREPGAALVEEPQLPSQQALNMFRPAAMDLGLLERAEEPR